MDLLSQIKKAESVEELISFLKKNHIDITPEEASAYFDKLNPKSGEMDDDELDSVSGGGCSKSNPLESPTEEKGFSVGEVVWLKNDGHCFGASADYKPSTYCVNRNCAGRVFRIVKPIDDQRYLIACNKCGWTYWAEKRNITG